jgi:hypothetical protein
MREERKERLVAGIHSFASQRDTKELDPLTFTSARIGAMENVIFETLAGRIRFERSGNGIHVEIPTRKDWTAILAVTVIETWSIEGFSILLSRVAEGQTSTGQWMAMLGFFSVGLLSLIWLGWSFIGKSRLDLDPAEFKLVRQILGIKLDTRIYRTTEVRNLRYLPCSEFRIFKGFIPGVFCFEVGDKTYKFGSGVTDVEAFALLNEMLDVYEFPLERGVHYIARRS